jgi:radical SAM superfamily enzyme YgiQ (UPF0313 family)
MIPEEGSLILTSIVLIAPPSPYRDFPDSAGFPMGLVMLAAMVRDIADVTIIDAYSRAMSIENVIRDAIAANAAIIGIGLPFSFSLEPGREIARGIRTVRNDIPIVMGGLEATLARDDLLKSGICDIVTLGESELIFRELVDTFRNGGIEAVFRNPPDGTRILSSERVPVGSPRPLIPDLDTLPFPAFDLLPGFPEKYDARIEGSRGCKFRCPFCASCGYWGNAFRGKSPGRIVDEMRSLIEKWGVRRISFSDDTFNQDRNRAREIAAAIERARMGIEWGASCNPSILDRPDLEAFARSGMTALFIGVESGSERVLRSIKQGHNLGKTKGLVQFAEDHGIKVHASFMIGLPDETADDIEATIAYARDLPASSLGFHIFHPLPGSEYGENPGRYGIEFVDAGKATGAIDAVAPIRTRHLSPMEILDYYYRARGIAENRRRR